jgi:protein required for attachment to host cells
MTTINAPRQLALIAINAQVKSLRQTPQQMERLAMHGRPKTRWLLIGDGCQAQLYTISAVPLHVHAIPTGSFQGSKAMTRDLESDRPGVSFESVGGARHTIERRSNAHRRQEDQFVARVAVAINAAATNSDFDDIVIVAPPRALAAFRKTLSLAAEAKTCQEICGEWTKLPTAAIEKHLVKYLWPQRAV